MVGFPNNAFVVKSSRLSLVLVWALFLGGSGEGGVPVAQGQSGSDGPVWYYGIAGSSIGRNGLEVGTLDGHTEIYVTGSSVGYFGANDSWQILRRDETSGRYVQVFAHLPYVYALSRLLLTNVVGDSQPEIVVGLVDGAILIYDQRTRQAIGYMQTPGGLRDLAVADLDGDGSLEFIVLRDSDLAVYDLSGELKWKLDGAGGAQMVIGQMDHDSGLEIATSRGKVIDSTTRTVQWEKPGGFDGNPFSFSDAERLEVADIDGDGIQELIASDVWYGVDAYDVDLGTTKWHIPIDYQPISALKVANLDSDPALEVLVGDANGGVAAYDTVTLQLEWYPAGPAVSGAARIAVADVDHDGSPDVLWGAGFTTTGPDHLYVANVTTRVTEAVTPFLDGRFVGPELGDLDGDGRDELVVGAYESDSDNSGRLLVFDAASRRLLGISEPVARNGSWGGLRDVRLRDVNGDGQKEIIVACDVLIEGMVEIYGWNRQDGFSLMWTNTTLAPGACFSQLDVLDVDGDGEQEVIAASTRETTEADGTYIFMYDLRTGQTKWRSDDLDAGNSGARKFVVEDFDGDGTKEIAVLIRALRLLIFDGRTFALKQSLNEPFLALASRGPGNGFVVADLQGNIIQYRLKDGHYQPASSWKASVNAVQGIQFSPGRELWTTTEGHQWVRWVTEGVPVWTNSPIREFLGSRLAFHESADGLEMFTTSWTGPVAFRVPPPPRKSFLRLDSNGELLEGSTNALQLTIGRDSEVGSNLVVALRFGGTAIVGKDYLINGARHNSNNLWLVNLPAGATSAVVNLTAVNDKIPEVTESIDVRIESSAEYWLDPQSAVTLSLRDDEPVVSVLTTDSFASEGRLLGIADVGTFTLHRTGSVAHSLAVHIRWEGTARNGRDYRRRSNTAVFRKGQSETTITVTPRDDRELEMDESVSLRVLSGKRYLVSEEASYATLNILKSDGP